VTDELASVHLGRRAHRGERAVPQYGHAIRQREDLIQPVRNVDDGDAARAKPSQAVEKPLSLRFAQGRRRLVENQ
jgi:hypothetical protein